MMISSVINALNPCGISSLSIDSICWDCSALFSLGPFLGETASVTGYVKVLLLGTIWRGEEPYDIFSVGGWLGIVVMCLFL